MQLSFISLFILLSAVPTAFTCEGDCIVGITKAFLGNYSVPIQNALEMTLNKLLPSDNRPAQNSRVMEYFPFFLEVYRNQSYSRMEKAIFPSYFHGKCQRNGVEPRGCPNPDCPVVCGTPGSLVHFYGVLTEIAFNCTISALRELASPGTKTYQDVERRVLAKSRPSPRTLRTYSRAFSRYPWAPPKRSETADMTKIMEEISINLDHECGPKHSKCSWEDSMKAYILSFP